MTCRRHDLQPLSPRPFQRMPGAAWMVAWCRHCSDMEFLLRNPKKNEPMVDQLEIENG
jgi:hypothetical protein